MRHLFRDSFILIFFFAAIVGCGDSGRYSADSKPVMALEVPPTYDAEFEDYGKLPWEDVAKSASLWSNYLYSVIDKEAPDLIGGSEDIETFCPNYLKMNRKEKTQFWAQLLVQVSKHESTYSPVLRYQEKGRMDSITGQPLYSEGLLQLSYQDVQMHSGCDFNWNRDQYFEANDPSRTILSPYKNLRCGVLILNQQIHKTKKIVINSGAYWAVLKGDSAFQKIEPIKKVTKNLKACVVVPKSEN